MKQGEAVVILGASPMPDRYAFRAFEMLREYGHRPIR
jgi:predicted CoA-binding protein